MRTKMEGQRKNERRATATEKVEEDAGSLDFPVVAIGASAGKSLLFYTCGGNRSHLMKAMFSMLLDISEIAAIGSREGSSDLPGRSLQSPRFLPLVISLSNIMRWPACKVSSSVRRCTFCRTRLGLRFGSDQDGCLELPEASFYTYVCDHPRLSIYHKAPPFSRAT